MPNKIIWTPLASTDFENILEYLSNNWSILISINFLESFDHIIEIILENPSIFPFSNKKLGIRKCVLTKHNTLFYREVDNTIELLRVFDTRQNPQKIDNLLD
jgi:plasmid stabilization system protein ParE